MQEKIQAAAIEPGDFLEEIADSALHPGLAAVSSLAQDPRTHHRSQRDRDNTRSEDRHDDRHGEFPEDSADDPGNHHHWQKHHRQRDGHGDDGKGDLAGAIDGCHHWLLARLDQADSVLQEDDGVIDKKTNRQGQRHQREVIQTEVKHAHHEEGDEHG